MKLLLIVLILIILVMISGGLWFYFNVFKKMAKEFAEFIQVTFEALKDKKLTIAEKEKVIKEFADIKPFAKQIKDKFIEDVKDLAEDIKELYNKIKDKVKKK